MALDYPQAINIAAQTSARHPFGSVVATDDGKSHIIAGVALHSETLAPTAVLLSSPDSQRWDIAPAENLSSSLVRIIKDADTFNIAGLFEMDVFRHVKGHVYTRLLRDISGRGTGPMTLYIAHADGKMWLRPQAMFEDGRFTPANEKPLTLDEMCMHRL
jgi:hypothetical protein